MKKQISFIALVILLFPTLSHTQEVLEVVTKSIQKSMPFELGSEVIIEGEKADVYLSTWDKNRVAVYLDLVASHPDKAQAEADLAQMDYELVKDGRKIRIKNFVKEGVEKTASQIEAKYTILLPQSCPVNLSNVFGSAQVRDLANALVVNAAYCELKLTNLRGFIDINTAFGDIKGNRISGNVRIKSAWTDMDIAQAGGDWNIESEQGIIRIDASASFANFNMKTEQTEIFIINPAVGLFNYEILAGLSDLDLPKEFAFQQRNISNNLQEIKLFAPSAQGSFKIESNFGRLVIPITE